MQQHQPNRVRGDPGSGASRLYRVKDSLGVRWFGSELEALAISGLLSFFRQSVGVKARAENGQSLERVLGARCGKCCEIDTSRRPFIVRIVLTVISTGTF